MPRLGPLESAMHSDVGEDVVENVTVLMEAAEEDDKTRVKGILASNRVDTSERDSAGRTALHYAAEGAGREVLSLVLDADHSLINAKDDHGYTALHLAVMNDNQPGVELLVDKGADVNLVDENKHSPLHWATVTGNLHILQYLLKKQALASTPDIYGAHALHYATQLCSGTEAKLGKEVLRLLLKHGANSNCGDYDERTPLLWAACSGGREAVLLLLEGGAEKESVDRDGLSALHCAASRGHSHIITALLQSAPGVPVDPKDRNGFTPLVYAVSLGHIDCAKLLIQNGASPNHQDKKLRTPAHCGAAKGQLATLKVLQQHGGSLRMANRRGDLPLHEAIHAGNIGNIGNIELVRWLLSVHPDTVAACNYEGRTGLHLAAANGDVEMLALLVEKGAPVNVLMLYKGETATALDLANAKNEDGAVNVLRDAGALVSEQLPEADRLAARKDLEMKAAQIQTNGVNGVESTSSDESKRKGRSRKDGSKENRKSRKDSKRRSSKKKDKGSPKLDTSDDTDQSINPASTTTEETQTAFRTHPHLNPQPLRIDFGALGSGTDRSDYPSISGTHQLGLNGRGNKGRYLEEKRIFQELASLKRMQIMYGKVQEEVLVKRLVESYAKGHHFIPPEFNFTNFGTWEKFLYDQLKHLYYEERDALNREARQEEQLVSDRSVGTRFKRAGPNRRNNSRVDRLLKTYGVAPLPLQYSSKLRSK